MTGIFLRIPPPAPSKASKPPRMGAIDALEAEMGLYAPDFKDERVETVYISQSSDSSVRPDDIRRILQDLRQQFHAPRFREVTVEVTPGEVTKDFVEELVHISNIRLSIEMLALAEVHLAKTNARFTTRNLRQTLNILRETPHIEVAADLMFGIPGLTADNWDNQLKCISDAGVSHITLLEYRTSDPASDGPNHGQNESEVTEQYQTALRTLEEYGFNQYELTHFARSDHRAKHTSLYWLQQPYLGMGPGARSFALESLEPPTGRRWWNTSQPDTYYNLIDQGKRPVREAERLSTRMLANEMIMQRLRLRDGLNLTELSDRYGIDLLERKGRTITSLTEHGLLEHTPSDWIRLTLDGMLLYNEVVSRLFLDTSA